MLEAENQAGQDPSRDLSATYYLRNIQTQLLEELQGRIDLLESLWWTLRGEWRREILEDFHRLAHSLHGEGATFGFTAVAGAAQALEATLAPLLGTGPSGDAAEIAADVAGRVAGGVQEMVDDQRVSAIERCLAEVRRASLRYSTDHLPQLPNRFSSVGRERKEVSGSRVVLVDDDRDLARAIGVQLRHYGYDVEVFERLEPAEESIREQRPAAVLMDIIFADDQLAGTHAVLRLSDELDDPPPILFLSSRADLEARLHAARAGGKAYFTKPVDVAALAERLDQVTGRKEERPFEVLIVDDDEVQARHYARILQHAGVMATVLTEPLQLLDRIAEVRPDLLLLDVYMPGCRGPELAEVLRQHETWLSVPIVFLSSESCPGEQVQALSHGADEFLTKPVPPEILVATVMPRARRGRKLGTLIELDGLTGLINHTQSQQRLQQEVLRAARDGSELSFAMIDLDDFKGINDTWGHAVGDRVLRSLGGMLKNRLRATDIIARYGGDEFAVVMPSTRGRPARRLMEDLCQAFGQASHAVGDQRFTTSISCGIATFPEHPDAESLAAAADAALYEVKRQGKAGVLLAGER